MVVALLACACGDDERVPDAAFADGPPAACGLEEPGTVCASATLLQRCDGTAVVDVDCASTGALCGPDPTTPLGEACVRTGDGCGAIGSMGACAGDVLVYCSSQTDALVVLDCGADALICALDAGRFECTTECALAGVTAEGVCMANAIHRCRYQDGAYLIVDDACPAGTVCQDVDETNSPGCLPSDSCTNLGPQGRCTGDVLTQCVAGAPQATDCAATGQVCGYGGDLTGYRCADPGTMGALIASGVVRYEDREPLVGGALGPVTPVVARGVAVAVVRDSDSAVLAAAVTADDGSYLLRYDAAPGAMVHVLAATTSAVPARPLRVIRPDGLVHGVGSASFVAAPATTMDLLVTDFSGEAGAFNTFDVLVGGMDYLRARFVVDEPVPLFATWVKGGSLGTFYGNGSNGMFLLGAPDDDDGHDDTVILHEMGHYIEDEYGRSDSPGGAHNGAPTDPRLAWSEGFATYWAMAVRGLPTYMDSNAGGGWSYDADTSLTTANMAGGMLQDVSEDMVSEILWDVADHPTPDDDPMTAGSDQLVLDVETIYATGVQFDDRGRSGMDLVDWLDGWFLRNGLGACAAIRAVTTTTRLFPYDYAGIGGTCP